MRRQSVIRMPLIGIRPSKPNAPATTLSGKRLTSFAKQLMDSDEKVIEFAPTLWNAMVEKVTVDAGGILHVTFKNGTVLCT